MALVGGERAFRALSCDLKGAAIVRAGGEEAVRHRAAAKRAGQEVPWEGEEMEEAPPAAAGGSPRASASTAGVSPRGSP